MVNCFKRADYCAFYLLFAYVCRHHSHNMDIKFEEKLLDILISCYNFNQQNNLLKKQDKMLLLIQLIDASSMSSKYCKVIEYGELLLSGALRISRKLKAETLSQVGNAYQKRSQNKRKAEDCLKRSLKIAKGLRHKELEATVCYHLGILYRKLGQYDKAIENFERTLQISTEIFDVSDERNACSGLGSVYSEIGENQKAKEYLEKALKISVKSYDVIHIGKHSHDLGMVCFRLGKYEKALDYYKKALQIAIEVGDKEGEDRACCSLGTLYRKKGDGEKAVYYQDRSLKIAKGLGDIRGVGQSLTNLGNANRDIGEIEKALDHQERGLKISELTGNILGQMQAHFSLGSTKYTINEYHSACTNFSKYISISDKLRNSVKQRDQFNMSMAKQDYDTHVFFMMTLLNLRRPKNALVVLDVGRSKAFFDLLRLSTTGINKSLFESQTIKWIEKIPSMIDDPTKDSHAEISGNIFRSLQDGTVLHFGFEMPGNSLHIWVLTPVETFLRYWSPPSGKNAKTVLAELSTDLQNRMNPSRRRNPGLEDERDVLREKNLQILQELPKKLQTTNPDAKEFLFEIQRNEKQKTQRVSKLRKPYPEEETNAKATSKGKDADQDGMQVKRCLTTAYNALIAPIEDVLTGSKLVIVPADKLFLLPFSALLDRDGKYLCDRYSIQFTPALHTLNFSLSKQMKALGPSLCVGNPSVGTVFYRKEVHDIPDLPGAKEEATECANYFGATPLLGKQATKKNVLEKMKNASVVHIAAHGNMNYGEIFLAPNPLQALTPTAEEHYLLMPEDITKCSLSARLVVLSCCHSGKGEISSEGVAGTARAFLGAGARSVLVALRALPDVETRKFMKLFYKNVCKSELSVCVALQQAMITFKERNDQIKAWAPLEIFGEDVTITSQDLEEIRRLSRVNMD